MRFPANFTPLIKILLYVMSAFSLVGLIVGILVFANVPIELTKGQATLLVSVCPLCMIITLVFASVHYAVTPTHLRLYVGFIDVFGGKVRLDKILNIVYSEGRMLISYLHEGTDPIISAIAINPKRYDKMKELLMSRNPRIVFFEDKNETDNSQQ